MNLKYLTMAAAWLCGSVFAKDGAPAGHTLTHELQENTQCLNPEYLVFLPELPENTKAPLLIFLHGGGGTGDDINRRQRRAAGRVVYSTTEFYDWIFSKKRE